MPRLILQATMLFAPTLLGLLASPALAGDAQLFESGKLLATAGVANVQGVGGGGITNWATIAGYGTRDAIGANVHGTYARLSDFELGATGAALGLYDRVEFSYTHQWFDTMGAGGKLGLGRDFTFGQDIAGAKVKLFGDIVYGQDQWWPQVAVGATVAHNDQGRVLHAIGARSDAGVDAYFAATKLLLDQSLVLDATLRLTKANQLGILGFGGPRDNSYRPEFEGSLAYLLSRHIVAGVEYRTMPSNLSFTKASNWLDVFGAWFITKNASVTLAYLDFGTIATLKNQRGGYLSAQVGF